MINLSFLEKQNLVNQALPPLARRYGVDKNTAWEVLESNLEKMEKRVLHPVVTEHLKVQQWFSLNDSRLSKLGLNIFKNSLLNSAGYFFFFSS